MTGGAPKLPLKRLAEVLVWAPANSGAQCRELHKEQSASSHSSGRQLLAYRKDITTFVSSRRLNGGNKNIRGAVGTLAQVGSSNATRNDAPDEAMRRCSLPFKQAHGNSYVAEGKQVRHRMSEWMRPLKRPQNFLKTRTK
jgi:hypothetical protein